MKFGKGELILISKNIALTLLGTAVLAFGTSLFIIPFDLVTGGVTGVAIALEHIFGQFMPIGSLIAILTWTLFFVGLFVLGRGFALKTFVSALFYPVCISLFSRLASPDVMNGFFCLGTSRYGHIAVILATIFGGALVGAGCALTFLGGGSTGGMDIVAFSICKIFKKLRSSVAIFCVDACVIFFGMFALGDLVLSLLGIVAAAISAIAVDKIFLGESTAFIAQIISDHCEEINSAIITQLGRTTTMIDAVGGYSRKSKKMLVFSFTISEYADFMQIVTQNDKNAFVSVHRAHEINGEGWS